MSLVTVVEVLLAIAVLFGIGVAATNGLGADETVADEPPPPLPPAGQGELTVDDLGRVRLPLAARGYRMAEVDEVLDRVGTALAERDAEIVRLRAAAGETVGAQPGEPEALFDAPTPTPPPASDTQQLQQSDTTVLTTYPEA